jgi:hypothetical protein
MFEKMGLIEKKLDMVIGGFTFCIETTKTYKMDI